MTASAEQSGPAYAQLMVRFWIAQAEFFPRFVGTGRASGVQAVPRRKLVDSAVRVKHIHAHDIAHPSPSVLRLLVHQRRRAG